MPCTCDSLEDLLRDLGGSLVLGEANLEVSLCRS